MVEEFVIEETPVATMDASNPLGSIIFPQRNVSDEIPPMASYPVQRSNKGTPITKVYGTVRVAGNILWMGSNHPWQTKKSSGGKGGGGSSVVTDSGNRRSFLIGVCEGPAIVLRVWRNKELIAFNGLTIFRGDGSADTGINDLIDEEFANYPNTCCVYFNEFEIGTAGTLPNFTFEVTTTIIPNPAFIPIRTPEEFNNIRNEMGTTAKYELLNNINLSDFPEWEPFGVITDLKGFFAELNGNGFTVSGLTSTHHWDLGSFADGEQIYGQGLIGFLGATNIYNLYLEVNIIADDVAGETPTVVGPFAVVSRMSSGLVYQVKTSGTIQADGVNVRCGGMIGACYDFVGEQCIADVDITANGAGASCQFGGFFARLYNIGAVVLGDITLTDCYSTGNISFTSSAAVATPRMGSLAYLTRTRFESITNVYASGDITFNYPIGVGNTKISSFIAEMEETVDIPTIISNSFGFGDLNISVGGGYNVVAGGFVADKDDATNPTETNCVYRDNTFGNDADSSATHEGAESYYYNSSSAVYNSWDFNAVWTIKEGVSLPELIWTKVSNLDENPAVIIKDLLTNTRYGAGLDESTWIDTTSFDDIEAYCDANGLRFSFALDRQRPVVDWINFILDHFIGYMIMSQGKLKLGVFKDES